MLHQVLHEIEQAQGPLSLNELARKLDVDRSVLDGMLSFWARKGRILVSDVDGQTCASGGGCGSCGGGPSCPFAGTAPRTFALALEEREPDKPGSEQNS
jgi:hypothetical protein